MRGLSAFLVVVLVMGMTCSLSGRVAASDEIGCTIHGFVTSVDGAPVKDASVKVNTALDAATTKTGANGEFYFLIGSGSGAIHVHKSGYVPAEKQIDVEDGQTLRVHVVLRADS